MTDLLTIAKECGAQLIAPTTDNNRTRIQFGDVSVLAAFAERIKEACAQKCDAEVMRLSAAGEHRAALAVGIAAAAIREGQP